MLLGALARLPFISSWLPSPSHVDVLRRRPSAPLQLLGLPPTLKAWRPKGPLCPSLHLTKPLRHRAWPQGLLVPAVLVQGLRQCGLAPPLACALVQALLLFLHPLHVLPAGVSVSANVVGGVCTLTRAPAWRVSCLPLTPLTPIPPLRLLPVCRLRRRLGSLQAPTVPLALLGVLRM